MLVERPELVKGREVLEIGAGTGVCGIVAAKLGASKVGTHLFSFLSASWTCSSSGVWGRSFCSAPASAEAQGESGRRLWTELTKPGHARHLMTLLA